MAGDLMPPFDEMPWMNVSCRSCGHFRKIMFGQRPVPDAKIGQQLEEALGDMGRGTGLPSAVIDVVLALVEDGTWSIMERIPPRDPAKPVVHIDADLPEGTTATSTIVAWDIDPFTGQMLAVSRTETRTPPSDHEHDWSDAATGAELRCELCHCTKGELGLIWPPNHHQDRNLSIVDRASLVESAIRRYERKAWTTPDQGEGL